MRLITYILTVILILYIFKVPSVVAFVQESLTVIATVWNYSLDVIINVKTVHPWIWIMLPFLLFGLMIPEKET